MLNKGYWLKSSMFSVETGEDQETNPRIYGRQFADWLASELRERGYPLAHAVAMDWGRCVICAEKPLRLWIGCGNVVGTIDNTHDTSSAVWHCFPMVEPSLVQRLFSRNVVSALIEKLDSDLAYILQHEPSIVLVEEPR